MAELEYPKEHDFQNDIVIEECDTDFHAMYAGGHRMTREMQDKYNKQIDESEGFDITLDLELGVRIEAPIVQGRGTENDPKFNEISRLAIDDYNLQNSTRYEFVENVTMNKSLAAGYWCYSTFLAMDVDATINTFQALGFWGISGERIISFCRLKKTSCDEGTGAPMALQ